MLWVLSLVALTWTHVLETLLGTSDQQLFRVGCHFSPLWARRTLNVFETMLSHSWCDRVTLPVLCALWPYTARLQGSELSWLLFCSNSILFSLKGGDRQSNSWLWERGGMLLGQDPGTRRNKRCSYWGHNMYHSRKVGILLTLELNFLSWDFLGALCERLRDGHQTGLAIMFRFFFLGLNMLMPLKTTLWILQHLCPLQPQCLPLQPQLPQPHLSLLLRLLAALTLLTCR